MGRWKKASPGEGKDKSAEQFIYFNTPAGLKGVWYGWAAHAPEWFKVHEHNPARKEIGTKPCLRWFTDDALRCDRCRPAVIPTTVAYLPVWREQDLKPVMVIIHESAADLLAEVRYGVHVMIGRADGVSSAYAKPSEEGKPWRTTNELRKGPCDLAVSLQTMWGLPQLDEWVRGSAPRGVAVKDDGKPFSPPLQAAARRYGADVIVPEAVELAGDAAADFLRRVQSGQEPVSNGRHKAPPKG